MSYTDIFSDTPERSRTQFPEYELTGDPDRVVYIDKTGKPVTEADIERWAYEAEQGTAATDDQVLDDAGIPHPSEQERQAREHAVAEAAAVSDKQLLAEAGIEPIFSTTETAEFFDRSNQWLYWGLRNKVFTDRDGNPLDIDRIGDPKSGRRRFTLPIIDDILQSSYRRGNIEPDELVRILRRIRIARAGGEWREREGWHRVPVTKNRTRWAHPDNCELVNDTFLGRHWALKKDAELEPDE
jgi:hypothetical protein